MAAPPSAAWNLRCPWCTWYIIVNARGMRGKDPGSGVEAANHMEQHVLRAHNKTWKEFLANEQRSVSRVLRV